MCNYLINNWPGLPGAPLQLGALSAHLVRLWVNPAMVSAVVFLAEQRKLFYFYRDLVDILLW